MYHVVATKDNQEVFVFPVHEGINTIGRRSNNQIVLSDKSVSRIHACLLIEGDHLRISDFSSANGTFYQGKSVEEPQDIEVGKKFYIGRYKLAVLPSEKIDWKKWQRKVVLRVMDDQRRQERAEEAVELPSLIENRDGNRDYDFEEARTDTYFTPITLMDDIYEERTLPRAGSREGFIAYPEENEGIEAFWSFMETLIPQKSADSRFE